MKRKHNTIFRDLGSLTTLSLNLLILCFTFTFHVFYQLGSLFFLEAPNEFYSVLESHRFFLNPKRVTLLFMADVVC